MSGPHSRKFPPVIVVGVVPTTDTTAGPAVALSAPLFAVTVAVLEMEDVEPVTMTFNGRVTDAPEARLGVLQVTVEVTTGLQVQPALVIGTPDELTRSAWPGCSVSVTVTPVTVAPVLFVAVMYQVRLSLGCATVAARPFTV
jgi:hypothetical protein